MTAELPRLLLVPLFLFVLSAPASAQPADTAALRAADAKRGTIDKAVAQLAGADLAERGRIEKELAEFGKDSMVPLKLAALSDNFELRKAAIAMSVRLRWRLACDPRLLDTHPKLIETMSGSDPAARAALVDAIVGDPADDRRNNPDTTTLSFFGECLADDQTYVRQRAIDGLLAAVENNVSKQQVTPYLEAAIADPDRNIRVLAIGALAQIGGANLTKLTALLNDESMEVRATIIQAIGRSREHAAVDHLKPLLKDPQWRIRAAALDAMAQLRLDRNSGRVADAVVECLADEDTFVRGKAAKLLADWKYTGAGVTLRKMLADKRIDEDTAFASLATLNDREAVPLMLASYKTSDPVRRAQLLRWLSSYEREARASDLFDAALKDEAMKAVWPQVIDLLAWQADASRHRPRLIELLLTGDDETAASAWNALQQGLREHPLEPKVVDALFSSNRAGRGAIALHLAYILGGESLEKALPRGLAHADAKVIDLALVLVAQHYLGNPLGGEPPQKPYDSAIDDDENLILPNGRPTAPVIKPKAEMTEALRDAVAAHLKHADMEICTRAAGILYRAGREGDAAVLAALRAGLKAAVPEHRRLALIAIASRPAPFLGDLDLRAAAADEITSSAAIEVMAASGDAKYFDTIKEFAENLNAEEPEGVLALIRSNQPAIIKIAAARVKTLEDYEQQRFHRYLRGMAGRGPVLFLEHFTDLNPRNRYAIVEVANVALSLPDPSVKALIQKIAKLGIDDYGDNLNARITARMLELDPEGTRKQLQEQLIRGDAQKQRQALEVVLNSTPSKASIELAWEGARTRAKAPSMMWAGVANWLPAEEVEGRWIKELGTLHAPLQRSLLHRVARDLKPAHLASLTAIGTNDPATREYLSALVAILTAESPSARPALDKVAEAALPHVLSAAGEWGGDARAVDSFLMDERRAVADGARRGLALHLIGKRGAVALPDAQRLALVAGAMSTDDITAFLSSEALALHAPAALTAIDLAKLPSDYPKMRVALLLGKDASPQARAAVVRNISSTGAVARAIAIRAALAGEIDADKLTPRGYGHDASAAELIDYAVAHNDLAVARYLFDTSNLFNGNYAEPDARLIAMLAGQARKESSKQLFMRLLPYLREPADGDLALLIASAAIFDAEQHPLLLDAAMRWAPAAPTEDIMKQIGYTTEAALVASAIAAICWDDAKARKALVDGATRKKAALFGTALGKRRHLAIIALRIAGKPEDGPALLATYAALPANERDEQQARFEMQALLMRLVPLEAARLKPSIDDERLSIMNRGLMGADAEASLLTIDNPAWKPGPPAGEDERHNQTRAMQLLERLGPVKAALATSPKAPAPVGVLPPWNGIHQPDFTGKRLLHEDAAGLMKRQLDQRMNRLSAIEKQAADLAARPSGAGPASMNRPAAYQYFADEEGEGDDDMQMDMMRRDQDMAAVSATAEEHYTQMSIASGWAGVAHLGDAVVADALKPVLESKWPAARIEAMRAAAEWFVPSLGDTIAKRVRDGADETERVEAAWALAVLRGTTAVRTIDEARAAREEFNERVRFASLLRALGSEAGRADIDRAIELRSMRALRLRFVVAPRSEEEMGEDIQIRAFNRRTAYDPYIESQMHGGGGDPLGDRLQPWLAALVVGAGDLLRADDARLSVRPEDAGEYARVTGLKQNPRVSPRFALTMNGKMTLLGASAPRTPIGALVSQTDLDAGYSRYYDGGGPVPRFMLLMEAEQSLEPVFFVQFADTAVDAPDLRNKWDAWWADNHGKPREQWLRQALTQATAELTHANWWHRLRAARRIMRLTGAKITPPNPFDLPAWKAMQSQWTTRGSEEVAAILLKHAVEAKVIAAAPDTADRAALAKALAHIAGSGPEHLSEAAMLHLHAWPDEEQLLAAALAWQQSPRRGLAMWVHDRMFQRTGRHRIVYDEGDLTQ